MVVVRTPYFGGSDTLVKCKGVMFHSPIPVPARMEITEDYVARNRIMEQSGDDRGELMGNVHFLRSTE